LKNYAFSLTGANRPLSPKISPGPTITEASVAKWNAALVGPHGLPFPYY